MSVSSKIFISGVFAISSFALADKKNSSFSFSKERGLQVLPPSAGQAKNSQTSETAKKETAPAESPSSPNKALIHTDEAQEADKENIKNLSEPENRLSEDFAPQTEEEIRWTDTLDTLFEDVSWFFQEKKTKHKIGFVPDYSYNKTQRSLLGLRFFAYSPEEKGYYFALSGSKYLFHPFARVNLSYLSARKGPFRSKSSFIYDNHYDNYFGDLKKPEGMKAKLSDLTKLYAHQLMADYNIFYQAPKQYFYTGLGAQVFFREERPRYQKDKKTYFEKEFFLFLKGFAGYDSRDNWKAPKAGAFHQISVGCKANFSYSERYCKGEGDFRFYLSLFKETSYHHIIKNSVLALRFFKGSSFFSPSPYSTTYSLGGRSFLQNIKSLRGFTDNRFRGDKMYFIQTEARLPLWKHLAGVLFIELGETAPYTQNFRGFVVDGGGGLRLGFPPDYDMKLRMDAGVGQDWQKVVNWDVTIAFLQAF